MLQRPLSHALVKLLGSRSLEDLKNIRNREQYWIDHLQTVRTSVGASLIRNQISRLRSIRGEFFGDKSVIEPSPALER